MRVLWIGLMLAAALCVVDAHGANQVEIRLVRAHRQPGLSPGLHDVAPLLRSNLPYPGFELLASTRLALPQRGQTLTMPRRLRVQCSGTAQRLSVIVRRDRSLLLNAVVSLRAGVPVILGGFPEGNDRLLLVLIAR